MANPNPQTAQLIPTQYTPGYDPRRVIPNNTGKTLKPSFRGTLRKIADLPGGAVQLSEQEQLVLGKEAWGYYKLLRDATDENCTPEQRRAALTAFSDRLHGKPLQSLKQSGSVQHTFTGRRLADIPDEEWPAIEDGLATKRLLLQGNEVIINAEFEEVAEPISGDSEA